MITCLQLNSRENFSIAVGDGSRQSAQAMWSILAVVQPPERLRAFPKARRARRKTWMAGAGMRQRWKEDDGTIFEWGYQHGHIEMYDWRGKHVSGFDAGSG